MRITDSVVVSLSETLRRLPSLMSLTVGLEENNAVSDDKASCIATALSFIPKLTQIVLGFANCNQIGDYTLQALAGFLRSRYSISKLHLNFQETIVTDKAIHALADSLISLYHLTSLLLGFGRTAISDSGLANLVDKISPLPKLSELSLILNDSWRVGDRGGESLLRLLWAQKTLDSVDIKAQRIRLTENVKQRIREAIPVRNFTRPNICLLYTSDAADDLLCVDLGGRRIIKKKK
eukprot:TRINITY_DN4497_c0_g1_i1.p1 TRINITY_DN4497_c0_g1~~TRINITY_DN4497_c0_g1_i1.p1  ORF type:complete len:236 (-),score=25.40 TRINITY_DN4497_c0_g1_i1:17-724(-)